MLLASAPTTQVHQADHNIAPLTCHRTVAHDGQGPWVLELTLIVMGRLLVKCPFSLHLSLSAESMRCNLSRDQENICKPVPDCDTC